MNVLVSFFLLLGMIMTTGCRDDDSSSDDSDGGSTDADGDTDADADSDSDTDTDGDCEASGAADNFSFFLTSWHHIQLLSGSENGFGGDLRYNDAFTGLEGADAICQEIGRRVCFGHLTWRAFLSTSQVDAIDRIGGGPWYDYSGTLVAENPTGLVSGDRPSGGCCDTGTYDELGIFHDGTTDVNSDGKQDDDHDVLTASDQQGRYDGFSCEDWTSTTATGEGRRSGPICGHSWPAQSGRGFIEAHAVSGCAAQVNFTQDGGGGGGSGVGSGGGYGALYCFAE